MINMNESDGLLHHPMMANNYGNFVMYNQNFHPYLTEDKQNHLEPQDVGLSAKERKRRARQNQSPEARARRLQKDAARHREYYKNETEEKRNERRARDAARHRESYSRKSLKKNDTMANGIYSEEVRNDQNVNGVSSGKRTASMALGQDHHAMLMQSSVGREALLQQHNQLQQQQSSQQQSQQQQQQYIRSANGPMMTPLAFAPGNSNVVVQASHHVNPAGLQVMEGETILPHNDSLLRNIGNSMNHMENLNTIDFHRVMQQQQQQLQQLQQQQQHQYQMTNVNNVPASSSSLQQSVGGTGGVVQAAIPLQPSTSGN